ncbi:MAG: hypothetical protein ABI400_12320 [Lacisediminihabitans sp.]
MKTSLRVGILISVILTALVGCAAEPASLPSTTPGAASPTVVPSTPTAAVGSAHTGLPTDVCTKMPLARVNKLTGWDLTIAQSLDSQGLNAAECHYANATTTEDTSEEVFALVMTGKGSGSFWQQSHDATQNGLADLPGVGKRAYTGNGTVAVDYGGLVIIVSDWGSLGYLDIDQARFLVDELHNLYS